jgi:hypothetical protein
LFVTAVTRLLFVLLIEILSDVEAEGLVLASLCGLPSEPSSGVGVGVVLFVAVGAGLVDSSGFCSAVLVLFLGNIRSLTVVLD